MKLTYLTQIITLGVSFEIEVTVRKLLYVHHVSRRARWAI